MSDPDTGDFEGLPPQEATDPDEVGEDSYHDPPDDWEAADRYGTTPREQRDGEPLSLRVAEEEPEERLPGPDDEEEDSPLGEGLRVVEELPDRG